jgi:hypothetical protein
MQLIRREFSVDAGLQKTWEHLSNVERWPTWARHIRRIELIPPGKLTAKSAGRIHLTNGIQSTFHVTDFNAYRNWKWAGPFLWLTVHYDHQFQESESGRTKLIWIVEAEGFGESSIGRLFAFIYQRNLSTAIPRLVQELSYRVE